MRTDQTIHPDRVALYIRWSTDDQSDGTTLAVQLEGCRHYVLSQGWRVNERLTFLDEGWSGGTLERPALSRLRELVRGGAVDCVVVFKLDRLSRSVIDMVNLVLHEWEGRTHVKSAREPIDTSTAMGKQFFYMLVSFAEWERSVIRERTVAGRRARAQEGYKPSAVAPYGYRHGAKTGSYEVNPAEAPVVRRIFDLYVQGSGAKEIVGRLAAEGVRFRGGALWSERTVLYMLSNPVYTGKMVYGRRTRNPRRGKAADEPYWLAGDQVAVVEKSRFIPPLVTDELFALTQQIKAARRRPGNAASLSGRAAASDYLLTGIARCRCGHSLYVRTVRRAGAEALAYYGCLGKKTRGAAHCTAGNIPRHVLDDLVAQEVLARYGDAPSRAQFREAFLHNLAREAAELQAAQTRLSQRAAKLLAEERRVSRDYREGKLTAEEFRSLKQEVERERFEVDAQQQDASQRLQVAAERRLAAGAQLEAASRAERWDSLAPREQKNLLRCFAAEITVWIPPTRGEATLHIVWH